MSKWCYLLTIATLLVLTKFTKSHEPFIVQYQWNYVNYTWESEEDYTRAEKDEAYIEKNNVISGLKFWRDNMYLTIPRWRSGVPVTLATISIEPTNGQTAPKLKPYPSWDMQRIGNCKAFQFVQNIEIDPSGRMWIIDTGRVSTLTLEAKSYCPPRLIILDIDNSTILRTYEFPAEVANPDSCLLSDIVLDHEDGGYAYIADSDDNNPGIIVYSLANDSSWKLTDQSMRAKSDAIDFKIEQTRVKQAVNINGLALSPASTEGNRLLYYAPLSSFTIFSIATDVLKNESMAKPAEDGSQRRGLPVNVLGRKPSQTDGMIMSNKAVLYFGLLADDAVSLWDSRNPSFVTGQRIISRDHHLMQWPDSFAFDNRDNANNLWCITNRFHLFLDDSIDIDKPNFRAIMSQVNMKNYQYYDNGSIPELPIVTAAADKLKDFAFGTFIALVILLLMR